MGQSLFTLLLKLCLEYVEQVYSRFLFYLGFPTDPWYCLVLFSCCSDTAPSPTRINLSIQGIEELVTLPYSCLTSKLSQERFFAITTEC